VIVARTWDEVDALADRWNRTSWQSERAELAYFQAEGGAPLAFFDDDGALVGRLEDHALESRLGYVRVYAPRVRLFRVSGIAGEAAALARAALAEVEVVGVPALPVASPEYRSLATLGGERFVRPWTRRRLELPESFDAFLASRSRKIRAGIRYDAKKLEGSLAERLRVASFRAPEPQLFVDLEAVSRATYQRSLGHGFSPDRADALSVALQHGWARVYVLYDGGRAIAYWQCGVHRDTMRLGSTGYLPEYARLRPGIYLLMRVIEDAIADAALRVLDFGPGRSDYKRHFSNDGYEERNLLLFAPTFRAQRVRLVRAAIAASTYGARRVLDATGATQRVKTAWRRRLRA
jgi:hypothetical protein